MGKNMDIASKGQVGDKEGDSHIDSDTSNNPVPGMGATLEETIAAIKNSLDDLHVKFDEQQGKVTNISDKFENLEEMKSKYDRINEQNIQMRDEIDMLKAITVKQSKEMQMMKSSILDLQMRSMRDNVLFHNIVEERDENCEQKIRKVLVENKYGSDVVFNGVHRLGEFKQGANYARPIVARLANREQLDPLLKFGAALRKEQSKGDANTGENKAGLKITPQFPAEMREKRRQLGETAEEYRQKDRTVKTKIVSDALFVNGQKHRDKLVCPTVEEILRITGVDADEMDEPAFEEESTVQGGSLFTVRATKVRSVTDVRSAYTALLQNPKNMAAKHNVAAYRLYDPLISWTENGFCDDGEFGMGRAMKDHINRLNINDVVVFMTRSYGGKNLGPRRFGVVTELMDKVLKKLQKDSWFCTGWHISSYVLSIIMIIDGQKDALIQTRAWVLLCI